MDFENDVSQDSMRFSMEILRKVKAMVEPGGFEAHPFLIGWYNEVVDEVFRLKYPDDTTAFLLISTPSMFEKTFVPFLLNHQMEELRDPIDQCMLNFFRKISQELFCGDDVDIILDFELHANKKPKFLAQTAAHVSGAAYLYHMQNLRSNFDVPVKKMMGLCLHPKFGGWFAIRGCLIFKNISGSGLPRREPTNILAVPADQLNALELFNLHWRDSRFRDVIPVEEKYSLDQQLYFNSPPGRRKEILDKIRQKYSSMRL